MTTTERSESLNGTANRLKGHTLPDRPDEAVPKGKATTSKTREKTKPTTAKTSEKTKPITLFHVDEKVIKIVIRGTAPLIVNRFGHQAQEMIEAKQTGTAAAVRAKKDPVALGRASIYLMPNFTPTTDKQWDSPDAGFPTSGFKGAMVTATRFTNKAMPATFVRGALHIMPDEGTLTRLKYRKMSINRDTVRLQNGVADLRYRAYFYDWEATITVNYNATVIDPERIVNLLNLAGFSVGIGEWRPEKDGSYGRFQVAGVSKTK